MAGARDDPQSAVGECLGGAPGYGLVTSPSTRIIRHEMSARRFALEFAVLLAVVSPAAAQESPRRDLEVVAATLPELLPAGGEVGVPLDLRNGGEDTWDPDRGYAVAYHWLSSDGRMMVLDGARSPLPEPVPPGATVHLEARLQLPDEPGRYLVRWDVVQEHVCWLSDLDPTPPDPIPVEVRASHAFTVLEGSSPRWLWAGGSARARLVLRNDGLLTWAAAGPVRLSSHWLDRHGDVVSWDGPRAALDVAVPPGGTVVVDGVVTAPRVAGRYQLQWDLVEEGECWFSQRDPTSEPPLPVRVVPAPAWGPIGPVAVCALLAAAAIAALRRSHPEWLGALLARGDLVWLPLALGLKQGVVLEEAGELFARGAPLLVAAGVLAAAALLQLLPGRGRPWVVWGVALVASAVLLGDVVYLRFFGDIVTVGALAAAGQADEVRASVLSLFETRDLWLLVDLVPGAVLAVAAVRLERRRAPARRWPVAFGLLALAGAAAAVGWARSRPDEGVLRQVFRNVFVAREVGVLNFHGLDLGRAVAGRVWRRPPTTAEVERIAAWFRERGGDRAGFGQAFGRARGRNLLMIQVESLQGFVVGFEVGGIEVTPALNRLAAGGLHFTAVADQTDEGRSSDSELATQTSLLPLPVGAAAFQQADNDFTGLAEVLGGFGYHSLSAVPFDGSFWNRRVTHRAYGFSASLFDDAFAPGPVIGWGLNDRDFLAQMAPRLEALERPFCAYLITLSLHHPFDGFPDRFKELDVGRFEGTPFGNYLHTMRFFDRALEQLLARLEGSGLLGDTVLALWGDHDAGLGWEREMADALGVRWHEPDWYLTEQVPLLIEVPGAPELEGEVALPAGQADLAPTLLALLGVDPRPYAFVGRNLLGSPEDRPVPGAYGSFVDRRHLFVPRGPTLAEGHCYDLPSLERVPPEACARGFAEAVATVEVSRQVLEGDLQQRLHVVLSEPGGGR